MMRPVFRRLRVVDTLTINDDFTDHSTDIPALLEDRRPAFGGGQETKRENVGHTVPAMLGERYGVRQDRRSDASSGVSVFWDRLLCRPIGVATDDPSEVGGGWLQLTASGSGLLARGVVWQDLVVRVGWVARSRVRVASTHRPPYRDRHLWPAFDAALADWCRASPLPVAVYMDANEKGGATLNVPLRWHGVGIDGVLTDLDVPGPPVALARRHSDHRTVSIPIRL